jgi:glutamate-1-semialdehyde 2,1-aminomutase
LFFFDMLEAGIYLARRGMVALTLPTTEPDIDRFVNAVRDFLNDRAALLHDLPA